LSFGLEKLKNVGQKHKTTREMSLLLKKFGGRIYMNFKSVRLWMIFLILLLSSGCDGETFIFSGESNNWSVHYEVEKGDSCQPTSGTIKFIGNEPIPKKIEYSYDKASGVALLDEQGVFVLPNGCTHETENSEIEITIKWDNQSETIPLTVK